MIRWLEHEGYDVSYATDVDLDANASLYSSHRALLVVGHSEYWTKGMYDHAEAARDSGVSLGFFSANNVYWQVRYEPSIVGNQPRRSMVGYKYPTGRTTRFWRPIRRWRRPNGGWLQSTAPKTHCKACSSSRRRSL